MSIARSSAANIYAPAALPSLQFSTTFAGADENPLNEGGKWLGGFTTGGSWLDFQLKGNRACASGFGQASPPPFNDAMAILKSSTFTTANDCYAEITVHRVGGYNPTSHELGLFIGFTLASGVAFGYEAYHAVAGNHAIVRWDGLNTFTPLVSQGLASPAEDEVHRFQRVGSVLSYLIDSGSGFVLQTSATDATYSGGQPGMQSYVLAAGGGTVDSYCAKSFRAGNL